MATAEMLVSSELASVQKINSPMIHNMDAEG